MATKKSDKQDKIVATLRQRIYQGKCAAGSRLPVRTELAQDLKISSVTLQRALDRLREEGFIHSVGRQGTFVAKHPPHLHHYALIFYSDPTDPETQRWSRFFVALTNVAMTIEKQEHRTIEPFYGINGN